jgi:alkylation response protein AidB-like acyl-CoA dehydrogenase
MAGSRSTALTGAEVRAVLQPVPYPGTGDTTTRWAYLRQVARADLCLAKLVESHLDALAILQELGQPAELDNRLWAVWASEPPGVVLRAEPAGEGWLLTGRKPFCSGATEVTDALVTASGSEGSVLMQVDLDAGRAAATVSTEDPGWTSSGMARCGTTTTWFNQTPANQVGAPGAYVQRPGFWYGGMGVAACWLGGISGVAAPLRSAMQQREDDPLGLAALGAVAMIIDRCEAQLDRAAAFVDDSSAATAEGARRVAEKVRAGVATAAEEVIRITNETLRPGPLAFDAEYGHRVDDLHVFVRQHHAARDLAALGSLVRERSDAW